MNAAIYSSPAVRSLRLELFGEHLRVDTSHVDDIAASKVFHRVAKKNEERRLSGDREWQGLTFALDVATYGLQGLD